MRERSIEWCPPMQRTTQVQRTIAHFHLSKACTHFGVRTACRMSPPRAISSTVFGVRGQKWARPIPGPHMWCVLRGQQMLAVRTGSWTGPPRGKSAPRVGISSTVRSVHELTNPRARMTCISQPEWSKPSVPPACTTSAAGSCAESCTPRVSA